MRREKTALQLAEKMMTKSDGKEKRVERSGAAKICLALWFERVFWLLFWFEGDHRPLRSRQTAGRFFLSSSKPRNKEKSVQHRRWGLCRRRAPLKGERGKRKKAEGRSLFVLCRRRILLLFYPTASCRVQREASKREAVVSSSRMHSTRVSSLPFFYFTYTLSTFFWRITFSLLFVLQNRNRKKNWKQVRARERGKETKLETIGLLETARTKFSL